MSPGLETSPHPAEQLLLLTQIAPGCREHRSRLGCSARRHPLWLIFSILWTFDPCPSFGHFLPRLLILVSLHFSWNISSLRWAKPQSPVCMAMLRQKLPARGRNNKGFFVYLVAWFVGFVFFKKTFSSLISSSLPTIKLVAMLRRQT